MPAPATDIRRRRKPWGISFFGLLAMGGLIAMPFLAGPPDGDKMPDIVRFLGHFHPVLLHLPIGVFALVLFQELCWIFGKERGEIRHPSLFPMVFGALSAIVATLAGFLLYQGGSEYAGNDLVERHMWAGLIFSVVAVLTCIVKAWTASVAGNPAYYRSLLFVSVGVMGFASHDGGSITHGDDFLTKFAPDPIRKVLGLGERAKARPLKPADPAKQIVYADIIEPIIENRCVKCHKESKSKGKLRMDTYEMLVKGGKEGSVIEPGKSAESNMIIRMELPLDDEEHMPLNSKVPTDPDELLVVKWWIDNGADPAKSMADYEIPGDVAAAIARISPAAAGGKIAGDGETAEPDEDTAGSPGSEETASKGPNQALVASVKAISDKFPGSVGFESQGSTMVTFTAVSLRGSLDDADFAKIVPVIPNLITADLSATKITDKSVAEFSKAENLRLIRLAETDITDAALDTLAKLPELESINLYGTKVTDAGVAKLAALPKLKHLYLWKTAVTPEAIKALQAKLPECEIVTGVEP